MFASLDIAASGLNAAATRLSITAGNIANADSAGYKARRANLTSTPPGGVRVDPVTLDPSRGDVDADGTEGSNVDIVGESVDLITERHQYAANAMVVKSADRMLGTLLDVLAK